MTNPKKDSDNTSKPNTAPAGKQNVREPATAPPTPLTFFSGQGPAAQTPTAAELGLLPPSSAPTTTQPAPAPAHDGAALSTVDTPAAPDTAAATAPDSGTVAPAVVPSPVTTPVRRQPSRHNASQQDVAAADSSPSKGKKSAAKPDKNAPREDALQAGQDVASAQLLDHGRRIDALDRALTADTARSKAQHSATTKAVADVTKRTVQIEKKVDDVAAGLDDIARSLEGLTNQWDGVKDRIAHGERNGSGDHAYLSDAILDVQNQIDTLHANFLDATETLSSIQHTMHENASVNAERDRTLTRALNMASTALETVTDLRRMLTRSDRTPASRDESHAAESRSSRRRDRSNSDTDGVRNRAPKVARQSDASDIAASRERVDRPFQPDISYALGASYREEREERHREPSRARVATEEPAPPPAEPTVACPDGARFLRMGASRTVTTIAFGCRNESHVALSLVSQWTAMIDPTGGIPTPIKVHCPPGLADNFRIFEFNNHADLVAFINAWQHRPDVLQPVVATPISDINAAAATVQSGPALGLLPPSGPSSGPSSMRRPSGPANKDPNGRRHF
ncbi:hypothetical protein EXIGLDRAFT_701729 [Exidia glandulosa HHB12029]|uniref:Uncharacterized protein n=1 Tax=Exidia glandulosa HHB12029 TaxID=1314781 RepID=A0A165LRI5_EXIGL|nr:hypothetical protein EXIGLDRAFT_701729 [Exidia glandulosa HHB12029]